TAADRGERDEEGDERSGLPDQHVEIRSARPGRDLRHAYGFQRAGPGLVCGQPSKRRKSGSPSASHDGFPAVAFLQPWQPRRAKPAAAATASGYDAGARTQRYWLTPPGFGETVASNLITTSLPSAGSHASSALDSTKLRCWMCWCFSG